MTFLNNHRDYLQTVKDTEKLEKQFFEMIDSMWAHFEYDKVEKFFQSHSDFSPPDSKQFEEQYRESLFNLLQVDMKVEYIKKINGEYLIGHGDIQEIDTEKDDMVEIFQNNERISCNPLEWHKFKICMELPEYDKKNFVLNHLCLGMNIECFYENQNISGELVGFTTDSIGIVNDTELTLVAFEDLHSVKIIYDVPLF